MMQDLHPLLKKLIAAGFIKVSDLEPPEERQSGPIFPRLLAQLPTPEELRAQKNEKTKSSK